MARYFHLVGEGVHPLAFFIDRMGADVQSPLTWIKILASGDVEILQILFLVFVINAIPIDSYVTAVSTARKVGVSDVGKLPNIRIGRPLNVSPDEIRQSKCRIHVMIARKFDGLLKVERPNKGGLTACERRNVFGSH